MALKQTVWDSSGSVAVEVHANGRARAAVIVWEGSATEPRHHCTDEFNVVSAEARERFVTDRVAARHRGPVLHLLEQVAVEVAQARTATPEREEVGAGRIVAFQPVEPYPHPVNGEALLDRLAVTVLRFVALPRGIADVIAVWILHTYCLTAACISPILAIVSPEKRCGKTTLLTLLGALVPRSLVASNVTSSALFRAVEQFSPTLLIDEADTFLTARDDGGELRGILNSSHARAGAFVVRAVPTGDSFEARVFSTWCAKAIALIGELPDTLRDRSLNIVMRRRSSDEPVERLRLDRLGDLEDVRQQAERWARDHVADLQSADPPVPAELNDRASDNWRPLLALADTAGGAWPGRARHAARLLAGVSEDDAGSVREQLLGDLRQIFADRVPADRLSTQAILAALIDRDDRPWVEWTKGKPLTARGLARLLKPFGIAPQTLREGPELFKGYRVGDLEVSFRRYLPPAAVTSVTSRSDNSLPNNLSVTDGIPVTETKAAKRMTLKTVTDVTAENGPLVGDELQSWHECRHTEDGGMPPEPWQDEGGLWRCGICMVRPTPTETA